MQVAQRIAGYSLGQADILRRAMGKKKKEVMIKEKEQFIAGAKAKGFKEKDADRIFEILIPFAGYGFNKSHAAAYSVVAYQTAYLKANFPEEFMAANLTNEIGHPDKLPTYIEEARKMGISIDPPDINRSEGSFTVVQGRIVYGFLGIKGLGDGPAQEIAACRKTGPYSHFMDFLDRVSIKTVGKKVIELLIQAGAFDCFQLPRAVLAENLERAIEYAQAKKDDKQFGQVSLFEETGEKEYPDFVFTEVPEWDRMKKLNIEKDLMGFYFSGHPMDEYKQAWEQQATLHLAHLETAPEGAYTLVGIIKALKLHTTKKGESMAFASLTDYNGEIELTFFPKLWKDLEAKIQVERVVAIKGSLDRSKNWERPGFLVDALLDLEKLEAHAAAREAPGSGSIPPSPSKAAASFHEVHIRLDAGAAEQEETLYPLRDLLMDTRGSCSVFIHVPVPEGETVIRTSSQMSVAADSAVIDSFVRCAGVVQVWCE